MTSLVDAPIKQLSYAKWNGEYGYDESIVTALEAGEVLHLPQLSFLLTAEEQSIIAPDLVEPHRKNISYRNGVVRGVADEVNDQLVERLLKRYEAAATQFIETLVPQYSQYLGNRMNTLRVHPVEKWRAGNSWRKDDARLHVDAFPSRPLQGSRILRVFTNISPDSEPRVWRVGEPFSQLAERLLPKASRYSPFRAKWLKLLKITKSYRTEYDHLMLQLHDLMKEDNNYQKSGLQWEIPFKAGESWICFSDQTPHAVMSGQYLLEQTFMLPVEAMVHPETSPLKILERLTGRDLLA